MKEKKRERKKRKVGIEKHCEDLELYKWVYIIVEKKELDKGWEAAEWKREVFLYDSNKNEWKLSLLIWFLLISFFIPSWTHTLA